MRQGVVELKGKQFKMYKADILLSEANEIVGLDVEDPRYQLLDQWIVSPVKLWPNGFEPNRLHIVIQLPQAAKPSPSGLHSVSQADQDLFAVQTSTIKYLNGKVSPSQAAKPSNLSSIQVGTHAIRNGRPHNLTGRPIALYHPVFDEFKATATRPPTVDFLTNAATEILTFIHQSRGIYQDKGTRLDQLESCFGQLLGFRLYKEPITSCVSDGVVARSKGGYLLISEWNNEIGTGGCDPSVQAAFSYCRYWGQAAMDRLRKSCCCPSFILAAAGPWMCVLGAIFLEHPVVEPLTDFIWIGRRDNLADGVESVAQIFQALTTGLNSLDSLYGALDNRQASGCFYPWVTYFLDGDDEIKFRYTGTLGGEFREQKAVFKARTVETPSRAIVVKFTRRYNGQAHKLLAEQGYAPKLLFDGSEHPEFPRPAGLLMMVMEYIIEAPPGPSYNEAYLTLPAALRLLHGQKLVFGDLRLLNVLVPKSSTDRGAIAMLIDFDWCGKDGEDRYPVDINTKIKWADGVGPGTLMHMSHDDFMLSTLL
ncbi:hypothetical protein FRC10_008103 [Ceratobasidium sp. 414]|nr:hypothetical protein FRC10_008103 [Ceratobasidium sp. 414]